MSVRQPIAPALDSLLVDGFAFAFEAFDGSRAGPEDSPITMRLLNERGLAYVLTAPGDLGFARASVR